MTVARQPLDAEAAPSGQSLRALDAVNFFVGAALAGFGPFVALFLSGQGWSPENIGFVLTLGGIAGLLAQYPGGELLDAVRSKVIAASYHFLRRTPLESSLAND